jgi:hypothetical protein
MWSVIIWSCKLLHLRTAPDVMLVLMQSYPDKAVQREVLALLVQCSHQDHGCEWQGQIKEWEVCPLCVVVRPFLLDL